MPTLEEALIAQGLVQPHQLEDAKRLDQDLRGGLGLNLVRLRHLTEDDLLEAFRRAIPGIQVADQAAVGKASSFALGLVPLTMIERFRAVPLSLQGPQLTLAMANPLDTEAITSVERHTRCKVVPALAAESVISWALLRYFNVLTPSYSASGPVGHGAATVSVTELEEEAGMAIPLLRRRRAPVGDTPEELSQVPVDLAPSRRKSLPPGTGGAEMGKLEAALARMERQVKRTVQAAPVETVVAARPLPPSQSKTKEEVPVREPTPGTPASRRLPLRIPAVIKTLPPIGRVQIGTAPAAGEEKPAAPAPPKVEEKPPAPEPPKVEEKPPVSAPTSLEEKAARAPTAPEEKPPVSPPPMVEEKAPAPEAPKVEEKPPASAPTSLEERLSARAPASLEEKLSARAPTSLEEKPPEPAVEGAEAAVQAESRSAPAAEAGRSVIKTRAFGSVPTPEPTKPAAEAQPPVSETEKTVVTAPPEPAETWPDLDDRRSAATVPAIVSAPTTAAVPAPAKPLAFLPPPMILPGARPPPAAAAPAAAKPMILPPELSASRAHEPVPRLRSVAVAKPLEVAVSAGATGLPGAAPSTRPLPLMPTPGPIAPVPEPAPKPGAPPSTAPSAPPPSSASQPPGGRVSSVPPPAGGSQPPGGRMRQTTPRMGMSAPFSPTAPGLPGLLPVSEQAVQRLRERIANLEDRDAVTASALWTVEEVLGPAAFVTRQEAGFKVHRAGKHFRAIFGEGELVLRPGQEPRLEHALAVNEAQACATEGFPLRPVGRRSVPPRVAMLPVMIAGRPAGVFVAFSEKALEVLAGEMPRYKVVTTAVSDRLLAILKKKKGK